MDQGSFLSHQIWQHIDGLSVMLTQAAELAPGELNEERARVRSTIAYLRGFKSVNPAYFSPAMLDNAVNPIASASATLQQYAASPQTALFLQALSILETALPFAGSWPQPTAKGGAATLATKIYNEYRVLAEATIEALETKNTADRALTDARLEQLQALINDEQEDLGILEGRITALKQQITSDEDRLSLALKSNNDSFIASQTERADNYRAWLNEQEEAVEEKTQQSIATLELAIVDAQTHLDAIAKVQTEVESAAGRATASILARDYGSYATREWKTGVLAYAVGFGVFVALAIWLGITVHGVAINEHVTWQFVSLRLGLTITAAAGAAVALQLGSKTLHRANQSKTVELELRAIGPFLADVRDEAAAQKAKIDFVDRTFGRNEPTTPDLSGGQVISESGLGRLLIAGLGALGVNKM